MKLLIDTNVVLDLLLKREPFYQEAAEVLKLAQRDGIQEYVSASQIFTTSPTKCFGTAQLSEHFCRSSLW